MEYISELRYNSILEHIFCTGTYDLLAKYICISVLEHIFLFWNTYFRIGIYISVLELRLLYRKKNIYICIGIYVVLEYILLYCPRGPP